MTEKEVALYEVVRKRKVIPSRFMDEGTLEKLGMLECMRRCLDQAGLGNLFDCLAPAHEELCHQFIGTSHLILDEADDVVSVTFKYNEREYMVGIAEVREALGVTKVHTVDWCKAEGSVSDQTLCDF